MAPPPSRRVTAAAVSRELAALELVRRRKAQASLVDFARSIDIPGMPVQQVPDDYDYLEEIAFKPVESTVALHHRVIMREIQTCMETANGRLIIQAPPGSAKSTYADVVAVPYAMGRWPGSRYIITTYATKLARKQSRKALQICRSSNYRSIWDQRPQVRRDIGSAEEWALDNGSEVMAAGILAGITGNRANGIVCDDLIANREEAESKVQREKVMDEFRDTVESRLLKDGWIILINTRWSTEDPCGSILPENYKGQSGLVLCQDGQWWRVLNLPAKAENADDPLGREIGEYLWPEWLAPSHWQRFENNPLGRRRWASLYQQRPTSDAGDDFDKADAQWYHPGEQPKNLRLYGASDYAVKEVDPEEARRGKVDKSEHGLVGMDDVGDLWFLDWATLQGKGTDKAIGAWIKMLRRARSWNKAGAARWWDEGGVIDKAVRPAVRRAMREAKTFVQLEPLPSIADKRAKVQSFAARYQARTTHWPLDAQGQQEAWAAEAIDQLVNLGAHRYDDKADVCGLIGRGIDLMHEAPADPEEEPPGVTPFTEPWLESKELPDRPRIRYK